MASRRQTASASQPPILAEQQRFEEDAQHQRHWKRWGPYLSERAWGTVREDYSPHGIAWEAFSHDHARSRAYRWNEDGLAGICDRHQLICFAVALWNDRGPILKERVFWLIGNEGNHGYTVEYPTGSGHQSTRWQVATEISRRLTHIFLQNAEGKRPVIGGTNRFQDDPHWRNNVRFYEYFHGNNRAGVGARHQTGWTGLVAKPIQQSGE